jgi:hypothetical protein
MSLGPMTTAYTPSGGRSGDCVKSLSGWYQSGGVGVDYNGPIGITGNPCLPPKYTPTSTAYYSPGLFCPVGYGPASSSVTIDPGSEAQSITWCCPTA